MTIALARSLCENATVPTARSPSCHRWRPEELERWHKFHALLVDEASSYAPPNGRDGGSLLLVGDSITEAFRGTAIGERKKRTAGVEESLLPLSADYPSPLILAISGDETQHLLWRLLSGELSASVSRASELWISLLIGTNNLGLGRHSPEEAAAGVLAVARTLLQRTRGRLLVHAILPRDEGPGMRALRLKRKQPTPFSWMPHVHRTNALVAAGVDTDLALRFPGRVRTADCGAIFRPREHQSSRNERAGPHPPLVEVNQTLMPDEVHPSIEGSRLLAECVRRALRRWRSDVDEATSTWWVATRGDST